MWLTAKPTLTQIEEFLQQQRSRSFSYSAVGSTRTQPPAGFDVDCHRKLIGRGKLDYQAACDALRQWQMFPSGWTEIQPTGAKLQEGTVVAMLARCFGRWWLNSCRIVYSIDETSPTRRFGFAYGTLPGHVECGEERFSVELDGDQQVWYEIYSFSRLRHWLARLAYPLARRLQRKFVRQSMDQMQRVVSSRREIPQENPSVANY